VSLTAADWLAVFAPKLAEPLFASAIVRHLRGLAEVLPGECQGILEVRLAPEAAQVDLSLRVLAAQAAALAARFPDSPTGRFLSSWSEPQGPLAPVRSVWLEFDLDREELADPVVCAKLPAGIDPGWLLDTLLPALQGDPLSRSQRDLIATCLDILPGSAHLLYVFSLRTRGSDAVRLEVFGMEPSQILEYLRRVAPRTVPEVREITPCFEGVERLHLSLDVGEEIRPRIGIEGSFPRQPRREPRWQELLGRLASRGLCAAEKRTAVLTWPGYDSFWTAPAAWPIAQRGARGYCVRHLSHLKVACDPGGLTEAKAYLAFGPFERPATTAAS
jgi:hypothetical protein